MSSKNPKVLYLDIENSRMIVEFPTYKLWDIKRVDPKYIKHDWYITCAAWAWLDVKNKKIGKVHTKSVADYPTYKKNFRDDRALVKDLRDVIAEADLIIGHNSDSFDIKKINNKISQYKFDPIDLPPTVDTLKVNKKYRKSSSNSLAHLSRELNCEFNKIELAPGTMHKADAGCLKSLKKLVKYNIGDIKSGASVYFELLPYIKNHPNIARILNKQGSLVKNDITHCGTCGSSSIFKNGIRKTKSGQYHRWMCKDCGSTTKGKKK